MNLQGHSLGMILEKDRQEKGEEENNTIYCRSLEWREAESLEFSRSKILGC